MSVSLFSSVLPSELSCEGKVLYEKMCLPCTGNPKSFAKNYSLNTAFAKLILEVTQEAALSLNEGKYKPFDALLKNFGCQLTALEVQQSIAQGELLQEAIRVKDFAKEKFIALEDAIKKPTSKGVQCGLSITDYLASIRVDMEVSPTFAKFVRLRLLSIVNDNKPSKDNTAELPITNCKLLQDRTTSLGVKGLIPTLINGLQAEEAASSAKFIQSVECINGDRERLAFISSKLGNSYLRGTKVPPKYSPILSLPLLYNTEAMLRAINGVVLVKNKLSFCKKPIADAIDTKVFLRMPENSILEQKEVDALDPKAPLIVIEGYVNKDVNLAEKIRELGIIAIIQANCAPLYQYASGTCQEIEDQEMLQDLALLKGRADALSVLNLDHFYCASVAEELGKGATP